ncbi:MAG: EF-P 5-aminopentanol modification-associated protein YfmF [Erysipelotrichaceae bacterium]
MKQITDGVNLTILNTPKFKTMTISLRFLRPLETKEASVNALLSQTLVDRTKKYPSKQAIANVLDALYGASFSSNISGVGHAQFLELKFKFINPRFAFDPQAFQTEILNFIQEVVFSPLLTQEVFDEGKKVLQSKIKRMLDDPSSYASNQSLKLAGEGTSLAISNYGDLETVNALTLQDLVEGYDRLVSTAAIEMIVVGACDAAFEEQLLKLPFCARSEVIASHYVSNNQTKEKVVERKEIPQTVINLIFNANVSIQSDDYMSARIMNAMLGVFPTSLLFQEVREKQSLCYSIHSALIGFDSILQISTGVDDANIQKTIDLIQVQVERLKAGDFSDELVTTTKLMLANTFKGINDDANSMINIAYQSALIGRSVYDETTWDSIMNTSKEDIVRCAQNLEPVLVYVLTKDESYE